MKKHYLNYLLNLITPAFLFGAVTGIFTAVVINLYKVAASFVIGVSEKGYHYLGEHLYWIPAVLLVLLGMAFLYAWVYKRVPNLRGGGIPTSIGILRGLMPFKWLLNLVGVFLLSLGTFLVGVPLGNEGPSVQMGTAIGRGSVYSFAKKHRAWDRYAMTGGACAAFGVATGAPISGILFAIEEAHERISPMIFLVSATAVIFGYITTELMAPLLGISTELFPPMQLTTLSLKEIWIPIAVGLAMGLLASLFLTYYRLIRGFFTKTLHKVPHSIRIFGVFALTLGMGLLSGSFISTGHELIIDLFEGKMAVYMLFLILLVRATLTLCANANGITGGLFVPILALGAVLSSALGKAAVSLFDISHDKYVLILVLGITACIASLMKTPLTAILFAVEALSCYANILHVILAVTIAFVITEVFDVKNINETVLDARMEEINEGKRLVTVDTLVTVQKGSFAVGKQIRDIFWPANLFVLSIRQGENNKTSGGGQGGKALHEKDVLHVHYSTYNEEETRGELLAIVGEQDLAEE